MILYWLKNLKNVLSKTDPRATVDHCMYINMSVAMFFVSDIQRYIVDILHIFCFKNGLI